MTDSERKLKKNGMLLKSVPVEERTEELCMIAVHQNPKALKYVPKKIQTEDLCKYALKKDPTVFDLVSVRLMSEKICLYAVKQDGMLLDKIDKKYRTPAVCRAAVADKVEALHLVPARMRDDAFPKTTERLVQSCLDWIKTDMAASEYLPTCVRADPRVLSFQKQQKCLVIGDRYYDPKSQRFYVSCTFYYENSKTNNRGPVKYRVLTSFSEFDQFYIFLDQNLTDAKLQQYAFNGVDLHQYNITGAVIDSVVLEQQGLYDDTFFKKKIAPALTQDFPADYSEITTMKEVHYPQPVSRSENSNNENDLVPIFYISDIHLLHRVKHRYKQKATQEEVYAFIKDLAKNMATNIPVSAIFSRNRILLIAGDTSSLFDFSEVFYKELVKYWNPNHIIVVSGNHELWDPAIDMEENIRCQRALFKKIGIVFLQNELYCITDDILQGLNVKGFHEATPNVLNEDQILNMSADDLKLILKKCPIAILGGIGFSGLNEEYNATNLKYGHSFENLPNDEARKKEIKESARFESVYRKLENCASENRLIILTHMQKGDWSDSPYVPNWSYVNGHNHRNYCEVNDFRKVYADNQVGYHRESVRLKAFYTDSDYDCFFDIEDGIHTISAEQYMEFYRGKRLNTNFNRVEGTIYMLKKKEYYMFFFYGKFCATSKKDALYLLNGGNLKKINGAKPVDIQYFFESLELYVNNVNQLLERYTGAQKRIAQFIRSLGGSGRIHGCIIDVDMPTCFGGFSYTHVFVNPIDGTVTPYYALDITARIVYRDFKALLENSTQCKSLLANYLKLEAENKLDLPALKYGTYVEEWGEDDAVFDRGGYLYQMSRIIKSLQYCTEKNIIRIWNENILNNEFVKKVVLSDKAEVIMNDSLIVVGN